MKRLIKILAGILLAIPALLIGLNNRPASVPDRHTLIEAREEAIDWLSRNSYELDHTNNPIIWLFLKKANDLKPHPALTRLIDEYMDRAIQQDPYNYWEHMFDASSTRRLDYKEIAGFRDYNRFFLYALTCDRKLADDPVVTAQLDTDFCPTNHRFTPACTTHQLMGMMFLKARDCPGISNVDTKIATLVDRVRTTQTWDFRVVDIYLQRVLMLALSGRVSDIKPVWIHRILDNQLADGGWQDFDPLLPLGNGRYLGWDSDIFGMHRLRGRFHTTAQGIYLTTLLALNPAD